MQSAGNYKEKKKNLEEILDISDHIKYYKSLLENDFQFGFYLTGLIEASGNFHDQELTINYHEKDIAAAYWLKKRIGFGKLKRNKNEVIYSLTHIKGLEYVINLINGKFISKNKLNEVKLLFDKIEIKPINKSPDLKNNFWLSGFMDGNGFSSKNFLIKIEKEEVKLKIKLIQKKEEYIQEVKKEFEIDKTNIEEWILESTSYKIVRDFIEYFDKYSLCTLKYIEFLKWRNVYRIIQRKEHLTERGIYKILKIQNSLENF
jgi:hypothetical protein